jgi:DNA-binding LacI/PurR family transcriptional regulator
VIGFDDSEVAELVGLTSIRHPLEESGRVAAETLLAEFSNPDRPLQHVTLKLGLLERDTT